MRLALLFLLISILTACATPSVDELDGGCACFNTAQELKKYQEEDWLHEGYEKQLAAAHTALWKDKIIHWSTENNGLRLGISLSHSEMRENEKLRIRIIVENCSTKDIEFEGPAWNEMITPLGSHSLYSGQIYSRSNGQIEAQETLCDCLSQLAVFIPAGERHEFFVKTCVHSSPMHETMSEMISQSDGIYYEDLYWAGSPGESNEEICVQLNYNEDNTEGEDTWRGRLESPAVPLTIHR